MQDARRKYDEAKADEAKAKVAELRREMKEIEDATMRPLSSALGLRDWSAHSAVDSWLNKDVVRGKADHTQKQALVRKAKADYERKKAAKEKEIEKVEGERAYRQSP